MTDLDIVREFRADVPGPDATRLAAGRSNLMKTINPQRPSHPHPASPSWWLPALAVTAAAAVAVGFLVVPGNHPAPPSSSPWPTRPCGKSPPPAPADLACLPGGAAPAPGPALLVLVSSALIPLR